MKTSLAAQARLEMILVMIDGLQHIDVAIMHEAIWESNHSVAVCGHRLTVVGSLYIREGTYTTRTSRQ
jgi:hypothetical protein